MSDLFSRLQQIEDTDRQREQQWLNNPARNQQYYAPGTGPKESAREAARLTQRRRDELMQDTDLLQKFLKSSESKYGFDMKQYDPLGKGKSAKSTKPDPTGDQFFSMWDTYIYNLEREHVYGENALSFGSPDYNPYDHSDDDNTVWGEFYGKYGRTPNQQEFETGKDKLLTDRKEKANKQTAKLLDLSYKAGDEYKTSNYWQKLGMNYDELDVLDMQRRDANLPPKAYLNKYNRSDPEDVLRLQNGEIPKYYDNTTKALQEFSSFRDLVMQMAENNQAVDYDTISKLYYDSAHPSLSGYEEYKTALSEIPESKTPNYDALIGKSSKPLREPLDEAALQRAGWSDDWLQKLSQQAVDAEKKKYGLDAKAMGWFVNWSGRMWGMQGKTGEQAKAQSPENQARQAADMNAAVDETVRQYAATETQPHGDALGWNGTSGGMTVSTHVDSKFDKLAPGRYLVLPRGDGKFLTAYLEDGKTFSKAMESAWVSDTEADAQALAQKNSEALRQGKNPPVSFGVNAMQFLNQAMMGFQLPQSAFLNLGNVALNAAYGRPLGEGAKLNMTLHDLSKLNAERAGSDYNLMAELDKAGISGAVGGMTLEMLSDPLNFVAGGAVYDTLKAKGMLTPQNLKLVQNAATKARAYELNPEAAKPLTPQEQVYARGGVDPEGIPVQAGTKRAPAGTVPLAANTDDLARLGEASRAGQAASAADTTPEPVAEAPAGARAAEAAPPDVEGAKPVRAYAPEDWQIKANPETGNADFVTNDGRFTVAESNGKYVLADSSTPGAAAEPFDNLPQAQARAAEIAQSGPDEVGAGGAARSSQGYTPGMQTRAAAAGYGTDPQNLINDLTDIRDEAAALDTEGGRVIVSEAQRRLDEFVNLLDQADETANPDTTLMRDEARKGGMSAESMKVLDRVIQGYENDMPQLISKLRNELEASKVKARTDLADLRAAKNAKLSAAEKQRQADLIALREKKNAQMEEKLGKLEAKRQADLTNLRERKNATAQTEKTRPVLKDLQRQFDDRDKRPLQPELKASLDEFLPALDGMKRTGTVNSTKLTQFLQKARDGGTGNKLIDSQWGEDVQPALDILTELNGRAVVSLSADEMKDLRKAMRSIDHLNNSAYQVHVEGKKVNTVTVTREVLNANTGAREVSTRRQTGQTKGGKPTLLSRVGDYFGYSSMELNNVVNILTHSTKEDTLAHKVLVKAFERAGWKHADFRLADHGVLTGLIKGVDKKTWFHRRAEYTLPSGRKVQLTNDELTAFYMNSKNADNRTSLANQIKLKGLGNKEIVYEPVSAADVDALIGIAESNPDVKRIGDGLFKWVDEHVTTRVNEASRERYGFDLADVDGYWPITRDAEELPQNFVVTGRTLETFGWLKHRTKSTKPIVLRGAMETAVQMSEESAVFAAYANPVKDAQRVIRMPDVQKMMRRTFGDGMVRYWKTFNTDAVIKQGGNADRGTSAVLWLGRSAQAAILSSPKVILNQFAGIASAVGYLNPKYLPKALISRANPALMQKYAPMLYVRRILGGSPEAGALMDMGIMPETGVDAIRSFMTKGIQAGDTLTMDLTWNWAELQVRAQNPGLSGEPLWQKVGDLAQEVVGRTQPTNEVGYRSIVENTKSPTEKLLLPFTSGTNKVYNMMVDAAISARMGDGKRAAARVGGIVANTLAFALVSTLWGKLWRGNDNEPFLKSLLDNSLNNIITTPYPGNLLYGVYRAASSGTDYNVRVIPFDVARDVVKAAGAVMKGANDLSEANAMPGKTEDERRKRNDAIRKAKAKLWGSGVKDFFVQTSQYLGVPAMQLERDVVLPILEKVDLQTYYDYIGLFKDDNGASADFKDAVKSGYTDQAKKILQVVVKDKGKESVKRSWQNSDWYKNLSSAERAQWDRILTDVDNRVKAAQ